MSGSFVIDVYGLDVILSMGGEEIIKISVFDISAGGVIGLSFHDILVRITLKRANDLIVAGIEVCWVRSQLW